MKTIIVWDVTSGNFKSTDVSEELTASIFRVENMLTSNKP
jgi:hypothetical protein